jgi:uncharacterized protein YifN (PemK superfamily)
MGDRRPFYPKKRMILMCDFERGGFVAPEMVKRRRVIVLRVFGRLALVVPLSATEPVPLRPFHAAIEPAGYHSVTVPVWAKADTLAHVSLERLDRVNVLGKNKTERIRVEDFERVLIAVAHATGTITLTPITR